MASKRWITLTAPDGTTVETTGLGKDRKVGAVRIMWFTEDFGGGARWLTTVHKTLANAITGPNQTPQWNGLTRWAIEIDENDQPVGTWVPATK